MDTGWKETLRKASQDMVKSLNTFGSENTLRLLLEFSKEDLIVNELLTRYPFIVAIGDFLIGKPIVQVDAKTFQTLMEENPDIWIKNNPKKENKICEKTPRRPKRRMKGKMR